MLKNLLQTIALLGAIVILSVSCSPQKRLVTLIKNHPELIKHDTIFKVDTIKVGQISKDTIFKNQITRDTVIIKQDRLTIKYFNSRDSVFISGKCDTIIKIVRMPIEVNNINVENETSFEKFWRVTKDYIIVALLAVIIVLMILFKKSKT